MVIGGRLGEENPRLDLPSLVNFALLKKMSTAKDRKVRVRRAPEAARDNILAAAERLLVEQGPLALKLVDVAAAAGVANASVLHHFGSIDDVHAALMERMVAQLIADVHLVEDNVALVAVVGDKPGGLRRET